MKRPLLALAAALLTATIAHPWGVQGHAAIALIAEQQLKPDTRRQIERILGNDDLASIASWMDDLRGANQGFGPLAASAEARHLIALYPHNDRWHYVDLPLGETKYRDNDPFARPDDVVHEIHNAVDVLEGRSTMVPPRIALYMLVHFVGDLHQPLHVACGYYDVSNPAHPRLITDPAEARGKPDDKGANALSFGPQRWDELHADWDTDLPRKVAGARSPSALAKRAMDENAGRDWSTPGDYHRWPEQWATQSIMGARKAYEGISFGAAQLDERGGIRKIRITLPEGYDARVEPVVSARIAAGGCHLAELLNSLHWQS